MRQSATITTKQRPDGEWVAELIMSSGEVLVGSGNSEQQALVVLRRAIRAYRAALGA